MAITTVLIGQKEGLPNVTGAFRGGTWKYDVVGAKDTGCFSVTGTGVGTSVFEGGGNGYAYVDHKFDAKYGETKTDGTLKTDTEYKVYGSSNHVTPCNVTVKIWQRVS